jgi:hypothetical protein
MHGEFAAAIADFREQTETQRPSDMSLDGALWPDSVFDKRLISFLGGLNI